MNTDRALHALIERGLIDVITVDPIAVRLSANVTKRADDDADAKTQEQVLGAMVRVSETTFPGNFAL